MTLTQRAHWRLVGAILIGAVLICLSNIASASDSSVGTEASPEQSQTVPRLVRPDPGLLDIHIRSLPLSLRKPRQLERMRSVLLERGEDDQRSVACTRIQDLGSIVLCLFSTTGMLNHVLGRAIWHADQPLNEPLSPVSAFADPNDIRPNRAVTGVNLPADAIALFLAEAETACVNGLTGFCVSPVEKYFFETFLGSVLAEDTDTALLASAAGPGRTATLSHEMLHGYFYAIPTYREAVQSFWQSHYAESSRSRLIGSLQQTFATDDEALLLNEYQAFLLQCGEPALLTFHRTRDGDALRAAVLPVLSSMGLPLPPVECP